jgi:hypothetical protein
MPLYHFNLRNGCGDVLDPEGTELPDVAAARDYGCALVSELIFRNEALRRHGRLVVRDANDRWLFELAFLDFDEAVRRCGPAMQRLIAQTCENRLALDQLKFESRMALLSAKAMLARSKSRPYLAADHGRSVLDGNRRSA